MGPTLHCSAVASSEMGRQCTRSWNRISDWFVRTRRQTNLEVGDAVDNRLRWVNLI